MPSPTYESVITFHHLSVYDQQIKPLISAKANDADVIKAVTVGGQAVPKTNNQIALGDAAGKSTESTLSDGSNLPTGGAVKTYVDNAVSTAISSAVRYRSTVATYADLPTTGQVVGDLYNITAADPTHGVRAGDNVVWDGTDWDVQSGTIDLSPLVPYTEVTLATDAQINSLFA